jgi:hypothetical protein
MGDRIQKGYSMTILKSRLPILFLFSGAVLRIATLGSSAIWYDEAVTLYRTTIPFMQLFTNRSENSGDLLLELILRPFSLAFKPGSLWLLRLPALLAGLISLWLVWLLMQKLQFSFRQQLITAALVAFLPGLLWQGQDGRPYGLLACLFLAALWFALEGRWLGLIASCGLMVYCHSTGAVYALGALAIAFYLHPCKIRNFLISGALIGLAWLPALLRIIITNENLAYAWGSASTFEIWAISAYVAFWMNMGMYQFFFAATVLAFTLPLLFSGDPDRSRIIPLMAWSIPLVGMMLFSLLRNVIIYRTLIPLLFPFSLWLGWELGDVMRPVWLRRVLTGLWAIALVIGLAGWHSADRGSHLDQIAAQIRAQWQPGDQLIYVSSTVGLPFEYYLGDLPHAWLDIAKDPLMDVPGVPRSVLGCQGPCKRWWVIIPEEKDLITPPEWAALKPYMPGQPVYSIHYMQAATIDVWLEDAK